MIGDISGTVDDGVTGPGGTAIIVMIVVAGGDMNTGARTTGKVNIMAMDGDIVVMAGIIITVKHPFTGAVKKSHCPCLRCALQVVNNIGQQVTVQ